MIQEQEIITKIRKSVLGGSRSIYKSPADDAWPMRIPLHPPKADHAKGEWAANVQKWARSMYSFADENGFVLETGMTSLKLRLPTYIIIPNEQTACRCIGESVKLKRRDIILAKCRNIDMSEESSWEFVSRTKDMESSQIDLLLKAGVWVRDHDTAGLAPRQIPIPGVQGKILDSKTNRDIVCLVAGKDDLNLLEEKGIVMIHHLDPSVPCVFTFAVPGSLDQRLQAKPEKIPHTAVIVENKATFLWFPAMKDTIVIYGEGFKADKYISKLSWISEIEDVVYWGDIDTAGLDILAGLRAAGVLCRSILMDDTAYERYKELGTSLDKNNNPISFDPNRPAPNGLTDNEARLYMLLNAPGSSCRRIEQEKIPYEDAMLLIKSSN